MTIAKETVYTRLLSETAGVTPRQFQKLLLLFGSPSEIFDASPAELAGTPGIGARLAKAIGKSKSGFETMETDTNALAAQKIQTLCFLDENYPSLLRALGDPPPLLFCRGRLAAGNGKSVAVIGPEIPAGDTVGQTVRIGKRLAQRGASLVTGLGKGVEASAQVGAVTAAGASAPTVLVLSCGHEADLSDEEIILGVQVEKTGALISEYPPFQKKSPGQEAASRRLVVALSQAVLVIGTSGGDELTEATFELAILQGKPIFVFNSDPDADFPVEAIPLAREEEVDLVIRSLV
jgi:DNA processing protein